MVETLFGSDIPQFPDEAEAVGLSLATRIRFTASGTITAHRWYFPLTAPSAIVQWWIDSYNPASDTTPGTNLASGTYPSPTLGAWNTRPCSVHVAAGDEILSRIFTTSRYVATSHYFTTDKVSGDLTGPLDDVSTPRRNGRFNEASTPAWPIDGFNQNGYFVDVEFTPDAGSVLITDSDTFTLSDNLTSLRLVTSDTSSLGDTLSALRPTDTDTGTLTDTTTTLRITEADQFSLVEALTSLKITETDAFVLAGEIISALRVAETDQFGFVETVSSLRVKSSDSGTMLDGTLVNGQPPIIHKAHHTITVKVERPSITIRLEGHTITVKFD